MTIIPQELTIRAINNLKYTLSRMPEGQAMNDLVDEEIRRLMKQEHPEAVVTARDIDMAICTLANSRIDEKPQRTENGLLAMTKNPNRLTEKDLELRVAQCSGFVRMMCGVANNAALLIMMDCLNKIADVRDSDSYKERPYRPHPRYKHTVKAAFRHVLDEKKNYRSQLLYPPPGTVRFFHLEDMPEESQQRYVQMTDREYFEFWEGTGVLAYQKSQPLIGSLWNKFRLSMLAHKVPCADLVAWGLVGATVLELSVTIYDRNLRSVFDACDGLLDNKTLNRIYGPFSLRRVSKAWQYALDLLAPETKDYALDNVDERNVALGVEQLQQLWESPDMPFDATIAAVDDFKEDVFRTKGYAKKAIRELKAMRDNTIKEMKGRDMETRADIWNKTR